MVPGGSAWKEETVELGKAVAFQSVQCCGGSH